jgi:hypothetical protein
MKKREKERKATIIVRIKVFFKMAIFGHFFVFRRFKIKQEILDIIHLCYGFRK